MLTELDEPRVVFDKKTGWTREPKLNTKEEIQDWFVKNYWRIDNPQTYLGDEPNTVHRDYETSELSLCMIQPNSYNQAQGNMAIPLLLEILTDRYPWMFVDRCYFYNNRSDMKIFEEDGLPFFGIQSKRPLTEFDVLGVSMCWLMPVFHLIRQLYISGIEPLAASRKDSDPLVILGGAGCYAPETVAGFFDVCFIGEAEEVFPQFLDFYRKKRAEGLTKLEILIEATKMYSGIYVPALYEEIYSEDDYVDTEGVAHRVPALVGRRSLVDGIPDKINKAWAIKLDDVPWFNRPIVPYGNSSMGLGQYEVGRGCTARCRFCQEGHTYLNYRERDIESIIAGFKESMKWSGTTRIVPYAFNSNDYTRKRELIKRLLEEVSDDVPLISQRIDIFAMNPDWAAISRFGGDKSITFGVEGGSERMRKVFSKGCSSEQLLQALENAFRAGYIMIKWFMIANGPFETPEDVAEIIPLLEKAIAVRDAVMKEFPGQTVPRMRVSYTTCFMQPFTPFQFHRIDLNKRTLIDQLPEFRRLGIGYRFTPGGGGDAAWLSQLLHVGDRRVWPALLRLALDDNFVYYGGNVKRGTKDIFEQYMLENEVPANFSYYFRQKHVDECLPWDFVEIHVLKKYLWREYRRSAEAMQSEKCNVRCEACGVCNPKEGIPFTVDTYPERNASDEAVDLRSIKVIQQGGLLLRPRIIFEVDEMHRAVPSHAIRNILRRAAFIQEIPVAKETVRLASDTIEGLFEWSYGVDYADFNLHDMWDGDLAAVLNQWTQPHGITVRDARIYTESRRISAVATHFLFQQRVPESILTRLKGDPVSVFKLTMSNPELTMAVQKKTYPAKIITEHIPVRNGLNSIWLTEKETGEWYLNALASIRSAPNPLFRAVLKTRKAEERQASTDRVDFFVLKDEDSFDLLKARCKNTGEAIPTNLFDEPYHPDYLPLELAKEEGHLRAFWKGQDVEVW